jgi:hypothetical protein
VRLALFRAVVTTFLAGFFFAYVLFYKGYRWILRPQTATSDSLSS